MQGNIPMENKMHINSALLGFKAVDRVLNTFAAISLGLFLFLIPNITKAQEIDLLLKGGHVIDPKNKIDAKMDVAIVAGKIFKVASNIPVASAKKEVDRQVARGLPFVFDGVIPDEYWMGTDQLARVIDYGVNLLGEDHMALGSDFDGGPPLPRQIKDISDYPEMTKAMQELGYSEKRIRKILGLNWLRVIRQVTEGR